MRRPVSPSSELLTNKGSARNVVNKISHGCWYVRDWQREAAKDVGERASEPATETGRQAGGQTAGRGVT